MVDIPGAAVQYTPPPSHHAAFGGGSSHVIRSATTIAPSAVYRVQPRSYDEIVGGNRHQQQQRYHNNYHSTAGNSNSNNMAAVNHHHTSHQQHHHHHHHAPNHSSSSSSSSHRNGSADMVLNPAPHTRIEDEDVMATIYTLQDTLGKGSFGTVKKARHIASGTIYACKIVSKEKVRT